MEHLVKLTGVLLLCLTAGCQKNKADLVQQSTSPLPAQSVEAGWTAPQQWHSAERPTYSLFYTSIKADDIKTTHAGQPFVLVFKKDNSNASSVALPYKEINGAQKFYWYYDVVDGNIMVYVDVYGTKANPLTNNLFKYVVLENGTVQDMEQKGIRKKDLMQMSYKDFSALKK